MHLPHEVRNLVYKELLVQPGNVEICSRYTCIDGISAKLLFALVDGIVQVDWAPLGQIGCPRSRSVSCF